MLALFRSKKNSLKWILWVMIVILGAGMVLLFVNPPTGTPGLVGNELARVADQPISAVEFRRAYSQMLQMYEQQFQLSSQPPELVKQMRIGDQALNSLLSEYAISYQAGKLGLGATDEEVRDAIMAYPAFRDPQTGGFVGLTIYERILQSNSMTPEDFEAAVRRGILRDKLNALLTDGIEPSPEDIRKEFLNQTGKSKVVYVAFDKDSIGEVEVAEEDLAKFFEENSSRYTVAEERKVKYVQVPLDLAGTQVTEEKIQDVLSQIPDQQQVRASHILFRTKDGEDEAPIRARATSVLNQIRAGADFAEMARQHSEDESGKASGGDLGFFGRGQMVPEFETVAFRLKQGEVSDLVKTPFGLHIIKVTQASDSIANSRRQMAEMQAREEAAQQAAEKIASGIVTEVREGKTLEEVAASRGLKLNETGFFTLAGAAAVPIARPDFNQQAFALQSGEVMEPYLTASAFLVTQLAEVKAAKLRTLEEARVEVLADFRSERTDELVVEKAKEFFRAARDAQSLEQAASSMNLKPVTTDFFSKGDTIDDVLKFSPLLHERLAFMQAGEASPPITVAGKQVVFELVERMPIDETEFQNRRTELVQTLRSNQRSAFFRSYLQNLMDQLREQEQIVIDRDLLDQITG